MLAWISHAFAMVQCNTFMERCLKVAAQAQYKFFSLFFGDIVYEELLRQVACDYAQATGRTTVLGTIRGLSEVEAR
jgi:hypothetical protein